MVITDKDNSYMICSFHLQNYSLISPKAEISREKIDRAVQSIVGFKVFSVDILKTKQS